MWNWLFNNKNKSATENPEEKISLPIDWLDNKTSIEKLEKEHMITDHCRLGPNPIPFGFQNARWIEFKSKIKNGDEIWNYASKGNSWGKLHGRAGICIVRNKEIIATLDTFMS